MSVSPYHPTHSYQLCVYVCVCVCVCVCVSLSLPPHTLSFPPSPLSVCLSVCLSLSPHIRPLCFTVCLSVCLSHPAFVLISSPLKKIVELNLYLSLPSLSDTGLYRFSHSAVAMCLFTHSFTLWLLIMYRIVCVHVSRISVRHTVRRCVRSCPSQFLCVSSMLSRRRHYQSQFLCVSSMLSRRRRYQSQFLCVSSMLSRRRHYQIEFLCVSLWFNVE